MLILLGRPERHFRTGLCFTRDVFFSPRVLRGPSTDRPETLPRGRYLAEFYNPTPKTRVDCLQFFLFYVIFAVLQLELRVVGLSITVSMSENGFWCILSLKEFYTPDNNKFCICEIFVRPFVWLTPVEWEEVSPKCISHS